MALSLADMQTSVAGNTVANLTFTLASVQVGDVLVFKGALEAGDRFLNLPTTSGETWTNRLTAGTTNATCYVRVDTMVATTAGSKTVTVTVSQSGAHAGVVEVWRGGKLAATPAVASTTAGGSAPSLSITTAAAGSAVSWLSADWNASNYSTITYRSSATQELTAGTAGADYFAAFARQDAPTGGAQTCGMTAPATQSPTMGAIEVQASASPSATVVAVPTTATATMRPPVVSGSSSGGVTTTAVATTATATMRAPAVTGGAAATVTAAAATASASMLVPSVASAAQVSGGGPATATATMLPPTVSGIRSATVTATPAAASASMVAPGVSAGLSGAVTAVPATATATAPAPTVSAVQTVTITAPAMTASGQVLPPTVTAGSSATVTAVPATATASVKTPTVTAVRAATIAAIAATASAQALAPTVGTGPSIPSRDLKILATGSPTISWATTLILPTLQTGPLQQHPLTTTSPLSGWSTTTPSN